MIRLSRRAHRTERLRCWLALTLRLGGRNRDGQKRPRLQGVRWRQVIGGDDIALGDMVFLCDPSERLAALDDNVRRDRGTGVWAIARRGGWRRNIRTLPARGQKRIASQYQ